MDFVMGFSEAFSVSQTAQNSSSGREGEVHSTCWWGPASFVRLPVLSRVRRLQSLGLVYPFRVPQEGSGGLTRMSKRNFCEKPVPPC